MGGISFAPVPGFARYIVSSDGRIFGPRRELKSVVSTHGYARVSMIRNDGAKINKAVHRVVLESFAGPPPEGMECAHLDGTRIHNELGNLKWCTRAENMSHKHAHGTSSVGERNGNAQLSAADVRKARALLDAGESVSSVARVYAVDRRTIRLIRDGHTWQHVK